MTQRAETVEKIRKIRIGNLPNFEDKSEIEHQSDLTEIKKKIADMKKEYYDGKNG